ncbi:MAG: heavy metal-associated domain-containing protein [Bacteroidia bacterium]
MINFCKNIMLLLFFTLATINVNAQTTKNKEIAIIKTNIFCNHCKECETCGGKIEKGLAFEKGVKKVAIDEKEMTIIITYNPAKTNPENLKKAISKLGYDADDVKGDPDAYSKLDECCKSGKH